MNFEELLKDLDGDLVIKKCEKTENTIYITCEKNTNGMCPYCNELSTNIHSKYTRTIVDLPMQNNNVKLLLIAKKFFCTNKKCNHKTFSQRFDFVSPKAVRTKRLDDYINKMGLRDNSMDAVRNLKDLGVLVSSNTVLRIVKKK